MTISTTDELRQKKCVPCEGGVPRLTPEQVEQQIKQVDGWQIEDEHRKIRREWVAKNFVAGMAFLNEVEKLAEDEQHHPDVHLTGYRNVAIEIYTHAIGGLSENDFILAAKIDLLPIETKS